MNTMPNKVTMNEMEAASYLGVSHDILRKMRREGNLPHVRMGDRVLYVPAALDEWLQRQCDKSVRATPGIRRIAE